MKPQGFLWPFSIPYGVVVGIRNRLYDRGVFSSIHAGVPTISVGNLSAGGTGKTPFVLELIERIGKLDPRKKIKIAVISRGYGRSTKGTEIVSDGKRLFGDPFTCGDEPYMIADNSPRTIVIVDEDRLRGANLAIEQFKAKAIILDDGFQHRRIKRDLDIVLLDGRNPLGNKLLLPAGFLREPVSALTRSDVIILSKLVGDAAELSERCSRMSELTEKPVIATRLVPRYWKRIGKAEVEGLERINGKRVVVFAGIAQPRSLFEMVEGLGGDIVAFHPLPDHCLYEKFTLDKIAHSFSANRAEWLVTTEKDASKLPLILKLLPAYALSVRQEVAVGAEKLDELLLNTLITSQRSE